MLLRSTESKLNKHREKFKAEPWQEKIKIFLPFNSDSEIISSDTSIDSFSETESESEFYNSSRMSNP